MLALKRKLHYRITLTWMRCMLSFALIRCAVTKLQLTNWRNQNGADVICVTETWLPDEIPDNAVSLRDFIPCFVKIEQRVVVDWLYTLNLISNVRGLPSLIPQIV